MEDPNLVGQILFSVAVIPALVLFYWIVVFAVLVFLVRLVKRIWNAV